MITNYLARAKEEKREFLLEHEAKDFLAAMGLEVTRAFPVRDLEEAKAKSLVLGYPVVLKISSARALHKSDLGGVLLNIVGEGELQEAYSDLEQKLSALGDEKGTITVQKMEPAALEVIVGMQRNPNFGPVLMFGLGGVLTEVLTDVTFKMIPLTWEDAGEMPDAIQGKKLLDGYRNMPAVDRGALQELIFKTSQICWEHSWIEELDLNPVLLHAQGLKVVDARIILSKSA
jgi:acyl-CoA synthetase (NDP forming)